MECFLIWDPTKNDYYVSFPACPIGQLCEWLPPEEGTSFDSTIQDAAAPKNEIVVRMRRKTSFKARCVGVFMEVKQPTNLLPVKNKQKKKKRGHHPMYATTTTTWPSSNVRKHPTQFYFKKQTKGLLGLLPAFPALSPWIPVFPPAVYKFPNMSLVNSASHSLP